MADKPEELELVYDGQCPVCRTYCEGFSREASDKSVTLIDARKESAVMDEINKAKLDIDEGMVLKVDGKLFYGAEAMMELSRRRRSKGFFGRVNRLFFFTPRTAAVFYALGKAFRNLLLRVLCIDKIRNLEKSAEKPTRQP